jgi:hypothetical protein
VSFTVNIETLISMRPNEYLFCDSKMLILILSIINFSINLCVTIFCFSCLQILLTVAHFRRPFCTATRFYVLLNRVVTYICFIFRSFAGMFELALCNVQRFCLDAYVTALLCRKTCKQCSIFERIVFFNPLKMKRIWFLQVDQKVFWPWWLQYKKHAKIV